MVFSRVHATTTRFVHRSVGWSVTLNFFLWFYLTSLLLPKWTSDLKYGPSPPARDFGSRVSGLVNANATSTGTHKINKMVDSTRQNVANLDWCWLTDCPRPTFRDLGPVLGLLQFLWCNICLSFCLSVFPSEMHLYKRVYPSICQSVRCACP